MGPKKTARNVLVCDGCHGAIQIGETFQIDERGYLLCSACAAGWEARGLNVRSANA